MSMKEYQGLQLSGEHWRISVLGEHLLRYEWSPEGVFEDRPTQVVTGRPVAPVRAQVRQEPGVVQIITAAFQLDYDGTAPAPHSLHVKGRGDYQSSWRYGQPLPNLFGSILGLASNLGGTARTLDGAEGPVDMGEGLATRNGLSVLDDSSSPVVDGDRLLARAPGTVDVYVFVHGTDHAGAVEDFYRIAGHPSLIPRWAFGNWWSRYHAYTQGEYEQLMDRFADEGIPFSVAVVDMDWHVTDIDPSYGHGWTGYTWNRELFPDPAGFLAGLHERGLHVTLNVHPADGIRAYEDCYPAVCAAVGRDPSQGLPVEFDLSDPAFRRAYFEQVHHPLEDMGVDFWWIDWQQGTVGADGLDPLWRLNELHTADMIARGRRPIILSRYAGPGAHRFPVGFSGDTVASWASLAFQPRFTATAANIGYGMWSHDIGGHIFGVHDDELATRWLQFGVFSPFTRLHSSDDPFAGKEPWNYGTPARGIMVRYLRMRHALVPYLYTEWATGEPLVRPVYHRWGDRPESYEALDEYLLGRDLLVAPITRPRDPDSGTASTRVWFPPGTWVDVLTGLVYHGDRFLTVRRPLGSIPVFARAGTIIPLASGPSTENPDELELLLVPGADASYELVEDDGAPEPATARTLLEWDEAGRRLTVHPVAGATGVVPDRRHWRVCLVPGVHEGPAGPTGAESSGGEFPGAEFSGSVLSDAASPAGGSLDAASSAAVRPAAAASGAASAGSPLSQVLPAGTVVDLGWAGAGEGLGSHLSGAALGPNEVARRVHDLLVDAQCAHAAKGAVSRILAHGGPLDQLVALREARVRGIVHGEAVPLPEDLVEAVREIIVADTD